MAVALKLKDVVRCPNCQSAAILYSCEPKCCFNHVCADCRASFQLVTHKSGRFDQTRVINPEDAEEPPSGDPVAACAACESLKLLLIEAGPPVALLCSNCRALLTLAIEDVAVD